MSDNTNTIVLPSLVDREGSPTGFCHKLLLLVYIGHHPWLSTIKSNFRWHTWTYFVGKELRPPTVPMATISRTHAFTDEWVAHHD
ncbi:hypothetical protein P692DRAFT_20885237 [Suillus brevipes Sb2]|jgi:hypothetical protein|nr:hypothetical protein P692DRAFT_20885237 [Suillus brevipes Sb2]